MANSNRFVSPYNTFPPTAQGQIVGFIRDPSEFKYRDYVQSIEAPEPVGFFYTLQPDQAVRMVNEAEFTWEDGAPRPKGNYNLSQFSTIQYACYRRSIPYRLGLQAVQNARKSGGFDPEVFEAKSCASQLETLKTQRFMELLQNPANWNGQSFDANVLNGGRGKWSLASSDENSPYFLAIKRAMLAMYSLINLQTNAKVKWTDMCLVVSPNDAEAMCNTSEIHTYLKYQASKEIVEKGGLANPNEQWGMPTRLYGMKFIVEDCPQVVAIQNSDGSTVAISPTGRSRAKADGSAIMTARPGGIDGPFGTRNFSTAQVFWHGAEVDTESRQDSWDRIVEGSVTSQFQEVLSAPASGGLITNIT